MIYFIVLVFFIPSSIGFASQSSAIYIHNADSNNVITHVIVGYGDATPGIPHYVEHLTWLNTVGGTERSLDRHSNAWTNNQAIGYWLSGKPEDLKEILKTLSGVFEPIQLSRSFAEQERNIILREYEYSFSGNLDATAAETMNAFLYSGNAIANSVIGTPEDIKAFNYNDAREFHAATHRPERTVLAIIGDVTDQQVHRALQGSGWPNQTDSYVEIAPSPFNLAELTEITLRYPDTHAATRMTWRRVVVLPDPLQFDLLNAHAWLLRDILVTNLSGGLAGPLRIDTAIARSFDVEIWSIDEKHIEISFTAAPDSGVLLTDLRAAFEAALTDIAAGGIPEETYSRVLNRFNRIWPDWDDRKETARWMADYTFNRISVLREPLSVSELKQIEQALSLEIINALLRKLAAEGRSAVAFIGPEEVSE